MTQATLTVQYLDPPKAGASGKSGPASIKDTTGVRWKFWTTGPRGIPFDTFKTGQTYAVNYDVKSYTGNDGVTRSDNVIATVAPVNGGAPFQAAPALAPAMAAPVARPVTNGKDKDIWIQAFGKVYVEVFEVPITALESLVNTLGGIYDRTHGIAPPLPQPRAVEQHNNEFNDEIPEF